MAEAKAKHRYVSKISPTGSVQLGGKTFHAQEGILTLDDAHAQELDALIAGEHGPRPDLVQSFNKIDEAAAAKIVANFRSSHTPAALPGTVTTDKSPIDKQREVHHGQTREALLGTGEAQTTDPVKKPDAEKIVTENGAGGPTENAAASSDNVSSGANLNMSNEQNKPKNPLAGLLKK